MRDAHFAGRESLSAQDAVRVLWARKWWVLVVVVVVVGGALTFSLQSDDVFTAEAEVLVESPQVPGTTVRRPNMQTERKVAGSVAVAEVVAAGLDPSPDPAVLLDSLSVRVSANTEILEFAYDAASPGLAAERAQAFADGYLEFRRQRALSDLLASGESVRTRIDQLSRDLAAVNTELEQESDAATRNALEAQATTLAGQVALLQQQLTELSPTANLQVGEVVAPAAVPTAPSAPLHLRTGLLAAMLGLALGVGVAFLVDRLDQRLRSRADLEASVGAPVLAVIPRYGDRRKNATQVVSLAEPNSAAAEVYRTLRTGLLFAASRDDLTSLAVTSPAAGDGKTTTTANLAVMLAQTDLRVIVVAADLRRPRLHTLFGLDNEPGLTNVLSREVALQDAIRPTQLDRLDFLPSGTIPANPAELLGSQQMDKVLAELTSTYEFVLIDSAPILGVADAMVLAGRVDGVLLVADAEQSSAATAAHAREALDRVNATLIAAVLNAYDPTKAHQDLYYGYGAGPSSPNGDRSRWQAAAERLPRSLQRR